VIVCVYAIVSRPPARIVVRGPSRERLAAIDVGGVTAIAGKVRRAPAPTMRNLRRYAVVIDVLASAVPAILPARFGTCFTDQDVLAAGVRPRGAMLKERLRHVRHRVQMTVRLVEPESSDDAFLIRSHVTARTQPRLGHGDMQGTQYLQSRAAQQAKNRLVNAFEPLRDAVRRFVRDERVDKRAGIATINHLVPRQSADAYRAALERAAGREGVRLILTGPSAPFAFADNW
jgi:hypothetical protein